MGDYLLVLPSFTHCWWLEHFGERRLFAAVLGGDVTSKIPAARATLPPSDCCSCPRLTIVTHPRLHTASVLCEPTAPRDARVFWYQLWLTKFAAALIYSILDSVQSTLICHSETTCPPCQYDFSLFGSILLYLTSSQAPNYARRLQSETMTHWLTRWRG